MEHFGAVFKLDLTETRTQLQEEEAIAYSRLILATPVGTMSVAISICEFEFETVLHGKVRYF